MLLSEENTFCAQKTNKNNDFFNNFLSSLSFSYAVHIVNTVQRFQVLCQNKIKVEPL